MSSKRITTPERAASILREVPPEKSFNFYKGIDAPLNVSARSLKEFAEHIRIVGTDSLAFHTGRQDFERWVSMLGDSELARKLGAVRAARLQGEELRTRLYTTTKGRLETLDRLGMRIPR
jgi:Family of unknown function (DUF5752)